MIRRTSWKRPSPGQYEVHTDQAYTFSSSQAHSKMRFLKNKQSNTQLRFLLSIVLYLKCKNSQASAKSVIFIINKAK
jgi:hypothetical protein